MPGLPRKEYSHLDYVSDHDDPYLTGPSSPRGPPLNPALQRDLQHNVQYIPPQMDLLSSTTTEASRESPCRLFVKDAGVLISNIRYLPMILLPLRTGDPDSELYLSLANVRDNGLQVIIFVLEAVFMLLAFPAVVFLPGSVVVLLAGACCLIIWALTKPMQGPQIVYSRMDEETVGSAKEHEHERWLFVNGIATGHAGLQTNIDLLSKTFGRPFIGIHNQTYGMIGDFLECLIQRDFSYNTMDVRMAYDYLKACLCDPTISKVVLVAHSQGGLIASMALDHLFADLPHTVFAKLEVYTFGSAASHLNNPLQNTKSPQRCISHIESYCNQYDMVARWGALNSVAGVLNNRWSGTVFVRLGATGHLFNQHYLSVLFPLPSKHTSPNDISGPEAIGSVANTFLGTIVDVDDDLALRRESTAMGLLQGAKESAQASRSQKTKPGKNANGKANGMSSVSKGGEDILFLDGVCGRDARGKTVRELSRLWLYMGGSSPGN